MTTETKRKTQKMEEGETFSWREKCIEIFELRPVPEQWLDEVAKGSEETWKNYYKYRYKCQKKSRKQMSCDEYDGGEGFLLKEWTPELVALKKKVLSDEAKWKWPSTSIVGGVCWDDDELRSGAYFGYVWSPYAIPHALLVRHMYHCRPRYSTVEFYSKWAYHTLEFEDLSEMKPRFTLLCSNCFEDESLRADVIKTNNLSTRTINRLRRHLFGSCQDSSKEETCDDFSFLRLLFGSMGTFDFQTLKGSIGYSWAPYRDDEACSRMLSEGVIAKMDDAYKLSEITWLEHRVREVTNRLRASDKYYKHPTIRDALGYESQDDYSDDYGVDYGNASGGYYY